MDKVQTINKAILVIEQATTPYPFREIYPLLTALHKISTDMQDELKPKEDKKNKSVK